MIHQTINAEKTTPPDQDLGVSALVRNPKFLELMERRMNRWDAKESGIIGDAGIRLVHGAAYAAACAANELLGEVVPLTRVQGIRRILRQSGRITPEAYKPPIDAQKFLRDMLAAVHLGVFGHTVNEMRRYFGIMAEEQDHPPGASPEQGFWTSYRVYLEPNGIISKMKEHLGKQLDTMVLSRADLRDQMASKPWWHEMNSRKPKWRFKGGKQNAWVIGLDQLPELGYRPVANKTLEEARRGESGLAVTSDKFLDPRKGEFYALVECLISGEFAGT